MPKLLCPKCNSDHVAFGREHTQYIYWLQEYGEQAWISDYDYGTLGEELTDVPICADCLDCHYNWEMMDKSVEDFLRHQ